MKKFLLWVPILLLLAACAALPGIPPTATSAPTVPPPSATLARPTQPANGLVLVYQRSGGIAGRVTTWKIYADGRVESNQPNANRSVKPEEVETLRALLVKLDFAALTRATQTPSRCADCFNFTITLYDGGQEYIFQPVSDGGPGSLKQQAVFEAIDAFLNQSGIQ